jgi:hypothetical protein
VQKIRSKDALIKSLLYEFHLDKPNIDLLLSKFPIDQLIRAANYTRKFKPFDLYWFKAKLKEYIKQKPINLIEPISYITEKNYPELKKKLDERIKHLNL